MIRHHLTREEMWRAVGMVEAGSRQIDIAERLGTTQSVISRTLARYRATGDEKEQYPGRRRITIAQ